LGEFNEFVEGISLLVWIKHGAKHIGSFVNYVGDPINEIVRLFEFEVLNNGAVGEISAIPRRKDLVRAFRYIVSLEKKTVIVGVLKNAF
jgi:hypothetical protein